MTVTFSVPRFGLLSACLLISGSVFAQEQSPPQRTIALPSSKMLIEPVPGAPQQTDSLPMAMAISPDGRYVAIVNAGYGTWQSKG